MPPKRNVVIISRKRKVPDTPPVEDSDLDDMESDPNDSDFDPDNPELDEPETKLGGLLEYLLKKANVSDEEHKSKTLDIWMSKIPLHKRRKIRPTAEKIYDSISSVPAQSDVLTSKMPFKEKCAVIEQLEILGNMAPGSEEYFQKKKEIFKRIEDYERTEETTQALEDAEKESDALMVSQPMPMKIRILRSDISRKNKAVLLEKLRVLETLSTDDDSHPKLLEWLEWGMKISDRVLPLSVSLSDGSEKINAFLYNVKRYMDSKLFGMVKPKERLLELLALRIRNPNATSMSLALCGPPGVGKCLHPDTQVLLFFGGMKAAKNIIRGDILMGDDNQPRIVMNTSSGTDQMYKIIPELGEPFIINSVHVLTLYNEFTGQTVDIPLNEYLTKADSWKSKYKLFSKPVEYQRQQVKNDPYLVGLLLGSKKKSMDEVIKEYLSKKLDEITKCVQSGKPPAALEAIDKTEIAYLLNHKYILDEYLYNTREVRYKLFKGYYEASTFEEKQGSRPGSRASSKSPKSGKSGTVRSSSAPKSGGYTSTPKSGKPSKPTRRSNTPAAKPSSERIRRTKPNTPKPSTPSRTKSKSPNSRTPKPNTPKPNTPNPKKSIKKYDEEEYERKIVLKPKDIPVNNRRSRLDEFRERILVNKSKTIKISDSILGEQLKFLIRSLGFECYQLAGNLVIQSEDINELPDMKIKNQSGFTVQPYESGIYSGFTLDGNGRFLLASCVVTHNTELIQTFCDATDQPFAKINMGGSIDPSHYLGHSYTYTGSTPGVLVRTLTNLKASDGKRARSGVMFFDEFDKIGMQSHVGHVFLHVSDPVQQKSFQDHYMPDITIDLSNLTFVYSMNDKKNIDGVLQNRLPIIELPGYSFQEKKEIATKYIIPKEMKNANITQKELVFTDEAVCEIISVASKEDNNGMRKVSQYIQTIINKLGAVMCSTGSNKIFSYSIPVKLPIIIDRELLDKLGIFQVSAESQSYLSMFL